MNKTHVESTIFVLSSLFMTTFAVAAPLSPTIYYIKTIDPEQKCDTKKTIYSVEGKSLAKVCSEAYKSCVIEGTCAILTKSPPPTESTKDEGSSSASAPAPLFSAVDEHKCPWGYGVSAICLDPYFTVAADLEFHKAGEVIFVDKLKGVKLPTGEVHSGFLIVRDKGGAIKGANRLDFFTGVLTYRDERNPFTPVGFSSKTNKFEYRRATQEESDHFRKERNYPGIPL